MSDPVVSAPADVRVLIVDDSVVVRRVLKRMLESDPGIRVIGMAADGAQAVELTAQLRPDLVTMDLMMPGMDGLEATARIMAYHPTPVLFFSSYFDHGGLHSRFDALAAGALDVVEKPTLMPDDRWEAQAGALVHKVRSLAKVPVITHIRGSHVAGRQRVEPGRLNVVPGPSIDVAAIGVSSGGPRVLGEILPLLPADFSLAVVVVQHMAEGFMPGLIEWLQQRCALTVSVAQEGDVIERGRILFAPDSAHLVAAAGGRVSLSDAETVNGHRPSVDVAFGSIAKVYGARAAGIVLTGMGTDGAAGLLAMRNAGGLTMVQNEESCVVFGMPRAAIELGAAERVLSPAGIVEGLTALHRERLRSLPR
jgi:two-component system, chemotaxis family, protein-glutamate methylesterase/glutaminase